MSKRVPVDLASSPEAQRIVDGVSKRFEVPREALLGRSRRWVICWPRFIAIKLIAESTTCRQQDIAELFGVTQPAIANAIGAARDLEQTSLMAHSDLSIMRQWFGLPDYK